MNNELDNGQYQDFLFALFRIHVIVNSYRASKTGKNVVRSCFLWIQSF